MIQNIKLTLEQGIELQNAFVEIQGYSYKEIEAKETIKGAMREEGRLVELPNETEECDSGISSVKFKYAIWANQQLKHQGKPHFGIQEIELDFEEHPEFEDKLNNHNGTDLQKFEFLGDEFLKKAL